MSESIEPIRVHPADDAEQMRARHAEIERRLDELGPEVVRHLLATGGLPTNWNVIIGEWLQGRRLATHGEGERRQQG